jgi:vancomycin permeability regulator SanA
MTALVLRRLALLVTSWLAIDAAGELISPGFACIPGLGWPALLALVLVQIAGAAAWWRQRSVGGEAPAIRPKIAAWALALALLAAAEIAGIHASGLTDHRRPADVILVLGARVYADGTPSEALAERVLTGVELYRAGLAPVLFMSGGVGADGVSEPEAMRRLAVAHGVPEASIVEDVEGANTRASVLNVEAWLSRKGQKRLLAVSHYHHLPRIQMMARRRGLQCATVHADEGDTLLAGTPYYVLREAISLVFYYLRG